MIEDQLRQGGVNMALVLMPFIAAAAAIAIGALALHDREEMRTNAEQAR
jgi:hypothetical protein